MLTLLLLWLLLLLHYGAGLHMGARSDAVVGGGRC
jgi:hypothetical protein